MLNLYSNISERRTIVTVKMQGDKTAEFELVLWRFISAK